MRVIANRPLCGVYGTVVADQEFDVAEDLGKQLAAQGSVRRAEPPKVEYETKPVVPQETPAIVPGHPFRNMRVSHQESARDVGAGDSVFSSANIQPAGTADRGRRGRRAGGGAERSTDAADSSE